MVNVIINKVFFESSSPFFIQKGRPECMVTSIIRIEELNSIVKLCTLRGITEKNFVNPIQ